MMKRTDLKCARVRADLSQKELAIKIGVSQQTIAKWELGVSCPSQFKYMREISNILGQPMDQLFGDIFDYSNEVFSRDG